MPFSGSQVRAPASAVAACLTAVGLLVQAGAIHAGPHAERNALAWHAYLWDPWFLLWGTLLAAAMIETRSRV